MRQCGKRVGPRTPSSCRASVRALSSVQTITNHCDPSLNLRFPTSSIGDEAMRRMEGFSPSMRWRWAHGAL